MWFLVSIVSPTIIMSLGEKILSYYCFIWIKSQSEVCSAVSHCCWAVPPNTTDWHDRLSERAKQVMGSGTNTQSILNTLIMYTALCTAVCSDSHAHLSQLIDRLWLTLFVTLSECVRYSAVACAAQLPKAHVNTTDTNTHINNRQTCCSSESAAMVQR